MLKEIVQKYVKHSPLCQQRVYTKDGELIGEIREFGEPGKSRMYLNSAGSVLQQCNFCPRCGAKADVGIEIGDFESSDLEKQFNCS